MSMPDPTLGRVQNDGYANSLQAFTNIQNNSTQGTEHIMRTLSDWQERDFKRKEADRARKHDMDKIEAQHKNTMEQQQDQQAWEGAENEAQRLHTTSERLGKEKHESAENKKTRELQKAIADSNNKTSLQVAQKQADTSRANTRDQLNNDIATLHSMAPYMFKYNEKTKQYQRNAEGKYMLKDEYSNNTIAELYQQAKNKNSQNTESNPAQLPMEKT